MVAKEAVPDIKKRAVGTGPFKLDRWLPGDHARFVRNESYWEPGLPYEVIIARRYTYYGIRKDRLHDFRYGIDGDWYLHRTWMS